MPGDKFDLKVKETLVLEKFDADGNLIERLTVEDGKIVNREVHNGTS